VRVDDPDLGIFQLRPKDIWEEENRLVLRIVTSRSGDVALNSADSLPFSWGVGKSSLGALGVSEWIYLRECPRGGRLGRMIKVTMKSAGGMTYRLCSVCRDSLSLGGWRVRRESPLSQEPTAYKGPEEARQIIWVPITWQVSSHDRIASHRSHHAILA
jgi:hypothetical protein